ncbi:Hypothetical predicted protein [Pelobates cultripes]|uniref:Uncharacterized protein n=1 Tax=Pelobates cultripes TaxID=61616 RepID=A0AAD1WIM1_PELCU|nr:Hypothetical predicted protein [Pelobates cultripes]
MKIIVPSMVDGKLGSNHMAKTLMARSKRFIRKCKSKRLSQVTTKESLAYTTKTKILHYCNCLLNIYLI